MSKPTRSAKWGKKKSQQEPGVPALILMMGAGCLVLSSPSNPYYAFLLFFSFLLAALTADILFRRCARVPADETAWRELFARFQSAVDATIYNLIGPPPHGHHAYLYKDIMQNFYLRLVENDRRALHAFRGKTEAEARVYLCRIAASIAITILQKERPPSVTREQKKNDADHRNVELIDTAALNEEYFALRASLDACLEKTVRGKKRRRNILIFKLAVYEGLAAPQIAALPAFAGTSAHAIDEQISRIRFKVRKCLKKIFFNAPK